VNLVYGVCVGSWDKLQANVTPYVGNQPLLGLSGQTSIAVAYNMILDAYRGANVDALVLQHDDLQITDPDAADKFLTTLSKPDVAIVGVAGGCDPGDLTWWNHRPIGHQLTDSGPVDFGERTGEVVALEGSILVFSPWAIKNLRFDAQYPGFHGYDCDIAMAAHRAGKRVLVADVDTHHHSTLGFKSDSIHQEWVLANTVFQQKWGST
jgi:hypothetical protein